MVYVILYVFSMTYTIAVCTVKNSWWWTEELSETCRVSFQKYILEISASSWFYCKNNVKEFLLRLHSTYTFCLFPIRISSHSIPAQLCVMALHQRIYSFGFHTTQCWRHNCHLCKFVKTRFTWKHDVRKDGHLSTLYYTLCKKVRVTDTEIFTQMLSPRCIFRETLALLRLSTAYRYSKTVFTVRYGLRLKKQLSVEY